MEYLTEQLLEYSFAAYRINKGYEKQTRRYTELPTLWSNKELVAYSAAFYNKEKEAEQVVKTWIPTEFIPVQVTEEDKVALDKARQHMKRYSILALGNISDFDKDIFATYSNETTPVNKIGLIAYLPAFVERELSDKEYKLRLKKEFSESKHFDKDIAGNCEILKVIRVNKDYEDPFYMHFGAINGNLVCFARKEGLSVSLVYMITAKVKGHESERETGLPMTRINYVKLRKSEA